MIRRFRRWLDRRRQPVPVWIGEREWMLLLGNMNYRDNRLQHNGFRNS